MPEPAGTPSPVRHVEPVMGTVASFTLYPGSCPPGSLRRALAAACARLHEADAVFSTWQPASPLSRLRRGEITLQQIGEPARGQVIEVLALCRQMATGTSGWFDPWALPGGLDPTGLVKGWAVEQALHPLAEAGCQAGMINVGGDLATFGAPPGTDHWRVGVRHPWQPDAFACLLAVTAAAATSAGYERGDHLIDPRSGRPAQRAASATVVGPRLAVADALATALAVGGQPALAILPRFEGYQGYLIGLNAAEHASAGMPFTP